jgi:hypothetical protein
VLALGVQLGCRQASGPLTLPLRFIAVSCSRSAWWRCLRHMWTYHAVATKIKIKMTPRVMAESRLMWEMPWRRGVWTWVMGDRWEIYGC